MSAEVPDPEIIVQITNTLGISPTSAAGVDLVPAVQFAPAPVWFSPDADDSRQGVWGDVDGDGFLDLVIARSSRSLAIYRNQAGVISRTPLGLPGTPSVTRAALGDMDGDGDLDLVTTAGNPSLAPRHNRIYRNDTPPGGVLTVTPVWTAVVSLNNNEDMRDVALADMDQDGDLDLLVSVMGAIFPNNDKIGSVVVFIGFLAIALGASSHSVVPV